MEYPTTNLGSGQPGYQHPQDQPLISPGCNSQPTTTAFPAPESGPHHRTYASYQQPYQPPHEYSGIPNAHPPPNPSTYYSTESHGQSLTLNQLLQQGSTPGGYQIRPHSGPPGQAPYRSYEPFPYGYKPGIPGGVPDRPQVGKILSYILYLYLIAPYNCFLSYSCHLLRLIPPFRAVCYSLYNV
ncbi:AT-rich interactive domain-containing protein 1 [Paragonimus heterotremus]|uniref:AT-rich interactive domain-containing protein 1 n=1 Tax=Paragonimus heterotremus TaxID=100268 RepID=A0A8J4T1P4_9TREM|nr:AT-rich interactive domain-containing protein 1 [Paragonimus heterotremus]